MANSRYDTSLTVEQFVAAITEQPDREGAAAFAAAILGEEQLGRGSGRRPGEISHRGRLGAALYGGPVAAACGDLHEGNFNPDEPRDERGRWTTDGTSDSQASSGLSDVSDSPKQIGQKDLDATVAKLRKTDAGKTLFDRAEKAAKAMGASGLGIKAEPPDNLPGGAEGAMSPTQGGIGIRNDLDDAKALETVIVELQNMAQAKALADLQKNDVTKMRRDEYIKAAEKIEFKSIQDAANVWKAVAQGFGESPARMPTYGDANGILKMDFNDHFKKLAPSHKENYGQQWDAANQ
jgi:hypothetical protein